MYVRAFAVRFGNYIFEVGVPNAMNHDGGSDELDCYLNEDKVENFPVENRNGLYTFTIPIADRIKTTG